MDHIGGRRPGVTARLHCVDRIGRDKSRETARSSGLRRPRPQGDLVAQHGTHACAHTEFVSSLPVHPLLSSVCLFFSSLLFSSLLFSSVTKSAKTFLTSLRNRSRASENSETAVCYEPLLLARYLHQDKNVKAYILVININI